ncbi:MAG: dihydroxy-acid dehydratase, partial [Thalassolituus sp.]
MTHPIVEAVTERIRQRSAGPRAAYLAAMEQAAVKGPVRNTLSCTNLAHDFASAADDEKVILKSSARSSNIAIITAYNDVLSAHAPYRHYPEKLKKYLAEQHHVAQVAGGVPAMCDGVTQGQTGMELSLFSRDVIAMSTAV